MRFILIQSPNRFLEQGYGVKRKVRFGNAPPLGIGYVAAYIERAGHEVRILDAMAEELSIEETVEIVKDYAPDVVGLSVLTNDSENAENLATEIKAMIPEVLILVGGPHATYFFDKILHEMPAVDHVLYGEIDTVILDYIKCLELGEGFESQKSLVYRKPDGSIQINEAGDQIKDLDEIPMPAWHLYNMPLYRPLPFQYRKAPFFTMITSRGCHWGRCKFCFQAGYNKPRYRRHSVARVIEEVKVLYHDFGIREIAFWDDSFVMNSSWIFEFTKQLKDNKLDISWVCSGRLNVITEEMVKAVYDAGCWSLFVGVESGNQPLLDSIDKGITLEQARERFQFLRKIGIETRAAFILGLPGETPEMGRNTVRFAIELNPTYAVFYAAHPRFGTELYDMAIEQGAFLSRSYRGMSKITYVPSDYSGADELSKMLRYAYRRFYWRPTPMLNTLKKLKSFENIKEAARAFILFLGLSDSN